MVTLFGVFDARRRFAPMTDAAAHRSSRDSSGG